MNKSKVFLTGGDQMNWALDDDLNLTRRALEGIVEFSSLGECDVIHSVSGLNLARLPEGSCVGKRIVCHVPGEPFRYLSLPRYNKAVEKVGLWIVQSSQAKAELTKIGISSKLIPYTVDTNVFHPLPKTDAELRMLRTRWKIPSTGYLIGNFHRDTAGFDLETPKLEKGPDVFVEVVRSLVEKKYDIHVILAGPRRFWIRRRLHELDIPYTFIGEFTGGRDDISTNHLSQSTLNLLYNLIDLYLVSSRSEGGPRSILEAGAARCKVISTNVGIAPDVLDEKCIYSLPTAAVGIIEKDILDHDLNETIEFQYRRVIENHLPERVAPCFQDIYEKIEQVSTFSGYNRPYRNTLLKQKLATRVRLHMNALINNLIRSDRSLDAWRRYFKPAFGSGSQYTSLVQKILSRNEPALTVCLWHQLPSETDHHFLSVLCKALSIQNLTVIENDVRPDIDVYLLDSTYGSKNPIPGFGGEQDRRVVHRIDRLTLPSTKPGSEMDASCLRLNADLASATILPSAWAYQRVVEIGYQPVKPIIIHDTVDPDIFHKRSRIPFSTERKIRLVSRVWGGDPGAESAIYKWLDQNLNWDRFEYTLVGWIPEQLRHIRQIPSVPSKQFAHVLRQNDICIIVRRNEPSVYTVLPSLACGLPVLYENGAEHSEFVGYGGLSFDSIAELQPQLELLIENYDMFQSLIIVPSLEDVVEKYLVVLRQVIY